jgi:tripartite-type tricarboxylate transporter receptor subunit TctC
MLRSKPTIGRRSVLGGLAGAVAAPAVVAAEGTYPNRLVRYINPYPAGGPTDALSGARVD